MAKVLRGIMTLIIRSIQITILLGILHTTVQSSYYIPRPPTPTILGRAYSKEIRTLQGNKQMLESFKHTKPRQLSSSSDKDEIPPTNPILVITQKKLHPDPRFY